MFTRSMTLLDASGDTDLEWSKDSDKQMIKAIQAMLDKGYSFFLVNPRNEEYMKRVKKAADITKRKVRMLDDHLAEMFLGIDVNVTRNMDEEITTTKRSTNPNEIAKSKSVATKPLRGG